MKARLGPVEGNFIDLWIDIPVLLVAYEPPSDNVSTITHLKNNQPQSRMCLSWSGPTYRGAAFSSWCADYIGTVNGFWDDKLRLRHSSSATSGTGVSNPYPTVRCRFHARQVPAGSALKRILVTAVAPSDQPTSSCVVLGGAAAYGGGVAYGYDSLLDSNDLDERSRSTHNHQSIPQVPAIHEMGHYIGLQHRCTTTRGARGATQPDSQMSNPDMDSPNQGAQRDAYCGDASDGSLTRDLMAYGMELNGWHTFPWRQIWEHLGTTPDGMSIPAAGWIPEVA
ncbi:MAG: hypothetical protein KC619_35745 [Myxococcales bacterium]|nr:hypothetical protein [Myxococcales bacterium]